MNAFSMLRRFAPCLLALGALAPLGAEAQSYRCVDKNGKKHYSQIPPPQCAGMPVEEMGPDGRVVKRIEPVTAAREKAAAAKEAEAKRGPGEPKGKVMSAAEREEKRRNDALLATYTSEAEIEQARSRALEDNRKSTKEMEKHIEEAKKRQAKLDTEMNFYRDGGGKPPATLTASIESAAQELKTRESILEQKKKEADLINAKYDEDKKRFIKLTKGE